LKNAHGVLGRRGWLKIQFARCAAEGGTGDVRLEGLDQVGSIIRCVISNVYEGGWRGMGDSKGAAHARQSQVCALACDVSVVWMCCAVVSTLNSFKYFHKIFASHSVSDRFSANAYIKHNRSVWCAVGASTSRC